MRDCQRGRSSCPFLGIDGACYADEDKRPSDCPLAEEFDDIPEDGDCSACGYATNEECALGYPCPRVTK